MGDNAAKTTPLQCSALRKGGYVMLKGHPCKIVDMSTSKVCCVNGIVRKKQNGTGRNLQRPRKK